VTLRPLPFTHAMDEARPRWRSRLRRWRWVLILLGVVIALRVALPYAIRYVLVSQGSKLLRTKVEVGDVDLWLLQGAVAIKDFALYEPVTNGPQTGSLSTGTAPADTAPAGSASGEASPEEPNGTPPHQTAATRSHRRCRGAARARVRRICR